MASLVKCCLVLLIVICNYSDCADAVFKKYAPLISDVHNYYGTSSVFFLFSRNDWRLQEQTLVKLLCLEFSERGIFTLMIDYDNLEIGNNFYNRRIARPLVVVMIKSLSDISEFNEGTKNTNKAHPIWLVIFADESNEALCEYCNQPIRNIFSLRFDTQMLVMCCHNPVLKEWWSINGNRTEIADLATWSNDAGLKLLTMRGLYARRHGVNGAGLRVAIVTSSALVHDYGNTVGGFSGRILEELQRVMNFTITKTLREIRFGSWSTNAKMWSGVVGNLSRGEADLGIGEFTITNSRRNVVDFTLPFMTSRNRLYLRAHHDDSEVQWFSYIEVFSFETWMTLLVLLVTSPILLTVIKMIRSPTPWSCLIIENYLHVWGIFCQEGVSQFPAETPMRIAYVSIFVSAVVVSAAYSASLISFLTISSVSLPFSSLAGFADDKSYKLIVLQNSSDYDFFASSTDPVMTKMMSLMKPWKDLPQTMESGFNQVCKEKVAYYTDDIIKKTIAIHCKLGQVDSGRADNMAMILSLNSPFKGVVNYHIKRFQENGLLDRLKKIYFHEDNTMKTSHSVVRIWAIVPILSILGGGIILALVMLIGEKIYDSKQLHAQMWLRKTYNMRSRSILSTEIRQRRDIIEF